MSLVQLGKRTSSHFGFISSPQFVRMPVLRPPTARPFRRRCQGAIRNAKKRGYVTHDQINALLSSEEVKSEQIEDIPANFSEMGVDAVDTKEAELEEEVATGEEPRRKPRARRRHARSASYACALASA